MKVIISIREYNEDLSNPKVMKTRELKKIINVFNDASRFDIYRGSDGNINSLLVTHVKTNAVNEVDIRFDVKNIDWKTKENEMNTVISVISDILKTIYSIFPENSNRVHISILSDIITPEMRHNGDYCIKLDINDVVFNNNKNITNDAKKSAVTFLIDKLKKIYSGEKTSIYFSYIIDQNGVMRDYCLDTIDSLDIEPPIIEIRSCNPIGTIVAGILIALAHEYNVY